MTILTMRNIAPIMSGNDDSEGGAA
jgi:hypothetical protein